MAGRYDRVRREYGDAPLSAATVDADPLAQLRRWLDDAVAAGVPEPNAMVLATADAGGAPSARTVLCKDVDDGVVFCSNRRSRKGAELAARPRAAAVFVWLELERQVRLEGACAPVDEAASDALWAVRPADSRASSAVSPQSAVIDELGGLRGAMEALLAAHPDGGVPRPDHWGCYRLTPDVVELWQGGPHRLHHRLRYRRAGGSWELARLAP